MYSIWQPLTPCMHLLCRMMTGKLVIHHAVPLAKLALNVAYQFAQLLPGGHSDGHRRSSPNHSPIRHVVLTSSLLPITSHIRSASLCVNCSIRGSPAARRLERSMLQAIPGYCCLYDSAVVALCQQWLTTVVAEGCHFVGTELGKAQPLRKRKGSSIQGLLATCCAPAFGQRC